MRLPIEAATAPRTPETHAYRTSHVGLTNTQNRKSVIESVVDNTFARNDTLVTVEKESISATERKRDGTNFNSSCDSREIPSYARDEVYSGQWKTENYNRQRTTIGNNEAGIRALSNVDHIYEEVRSIKEPRGGLYEHDIRYYYEKYSPTTAKTSIDTLFLPRYAICRECARPGGSPVYTDRLICTKESLLAVEVVLCQRDDVSCFKYLCEDSDNIFRLQYNHSQDYMLVYNYVKTNAAGIFYSHCWPRDVFDLQSLLKPSIHVVNRTCYNLAVNTQLYHRCINSYYVRTSRTGCAPMSFYRDCSVPISCTKRISHNDSEDPPIYQMHHLKNIYADEQRKNRSSLLLLEPLMLMSESADSEHREDTKDRTLRSERTKVIRIIMTYALSFLILASITFYIVYFT